MTKKEEEKVACCIELGKFFLEVELLGAMLVAAIGVICLINMIR